MNDTEINNYLKKFKGQYFVKRNQGNEFIIDGTLGTIAPYNPEKALLGCWCINLPPRLKKSILKRLNGIFIEVHQDCDDEFGAYFHEKDLDKVARVIKAKKKRILSAEQKQRLSVLAKNNFKKR
jgi:hypothetical protein